jgi:hypothetical protein
VLLPLTPWHATQVAALAAPASAEPAASAEDVTRGIVPTARTHHTRRIIDIICSRLARKGTHQLYTSGSQA